MTKTAKVVLGIGAAALIAGTVVFLVQTSGDSPIDVTDGSIKLEFEKGFDEVVDATAHKKTLKPKKGPAKTTEIEVLDQSGAEKEFYLRIGVTGRDWTITSDVSQVTITRAGADEISIESPAHDPITTDGGLTYTIAGAQFTSANLSFIPEKPIPLTCPSGKCRVRIHLK